MSKTGRTYGAITARIYSVAARGKPFTRHDIGEGRNVNNMLLRLWRRGELRRIKAGRTGVPAVPSVYQGIAERTTQQTTGDAGGRVKEKQS